MIYTKADIIQEPDAQLHQESAEIEQITLEVYDELMGMWEFVTSIENCCGFAAPQLGIMKRAIMIKLGHAWVLVINPEIVRHSPKIVTSNEFCLSVKLSSIAVNVRRWKYVTVKGLDTQGTSRTYRTQRDLIGMAFQHEIDHLDGKTTIYHGGLE